PLVERPAADAKVGAHLRDGELVPLSAAARLVRAGHDGGSQPPRRAGYPAPVGRATRTRVSLVTLLPARGVKGAPPSPPKGVVSRGCRLLGGLGEPSTQTCSGRTGSGCLSGRLIQAMGRVARRCGPDAWFHAGTAFVILPVSVGFQPGTFGNARLSIQTVAGTCPAQTPPACQGGGAVSAGVRRRPPAPAWDRKTSEI